MKTLLRNFALGMLLGLPGVVYSAVAIAEGNFGECCGSLCDEAKKCKYCKMFCNASCNTKGAEERCRSACDAHPRDHPCLDKPKKPANIGNGM